MLMEALFAILLFMLNATFVTGTLTVKVAVLLLSICPVASIMRQYTCLPFIAAVMVPEMADELPFDHVVQLELAEAL